MMKKKIFFTVTNSLTYDQRMIRICTSLSRAGFEVTLIGRESGPTIPIVPRSFMQKRLPLYFEKGKLFYLEYNIRLFFFLLFHPADCLCAIDLDTIVPCWLVSKFKGIPRVYDAHELFCEMQEVVNRPFIYKLWKKVERTCVPAFRYGYTVNGLIAGEFEKMYGVKYEVIRNIAVSEPFIPPSKTEKFILYQGAVNEGRCFEILIPAMRYVNAPLVICGEGNFIVQTRGLVKKYGLEDKVIFKGNVLPEELKTITRAAWCGITLFEETGSSNYYSLANRFFDYLHAGIPQLASDFPAYREINNIHPIAVLLKKQDSENLAAALNELLDNEMLYNYLQANCFLVKQTYSWQQEEKKLIRLYEQIFQ